jgi:hypothetical protein
MPAKAPPTKHVWKFFRTGGLDQVALETAEDLLALPELDQKLWVVLSCPTKGLELDEKTLDLIDTDQDGHIHVREVIAAVEWAAAHLKRPGDLLAPKPALPLDAINDLVPEGRDLLSSARRILANLDKADATSIAVEDTIDTAKILAAKAPNGDGVVTLRASTDPATQALIKDIIATVGGVPDRAGGEGITAEKVEAFFNEVKSYLEWFATITSKDISVLGDGTGGACQALTAIRPKVEDYFARERLAEFDHRALAAVNRQESEYLAVAARDLTITAPEVAAFPLARVEAGRPLPLRQGVNPAWAEAMAKLHQEVVVPMFGADKTALTPEDWGAINKRFAAYEACLNAKVSSKVEKLGATRIKAIMEGDARQKLDALIAEDKALAPQYNAISSVAKLARYYRDLRTLLRNFVNFADFYAPDRLAVFQAGRLYLDSRACELCVPVHDVNAHAAMATMSKAYVAYLDCRRTGGETMKIAACFTQGDSDYLMVGRNGLFYDRRGRDWDATITKVIDNPISIRQAFWAPYKKFIRFLEEQVAKRAAASEAASTAKLQGAATTIAAAPPAAPTPPAPAAPVPPPKKFDVGTVAALGVGVGALMTAFGMVFSNVVHLPGWQLPLVILGVVLVISLPSMAVAALKIRQRTVGPLLEANGWAINGRVKVNIPFGTALTEKAALPANARRSLRDPYEDKAAVRRRRAVWFVILLAAAALIFAYRMKTWPFEPKAGNEAKATATSAAAKK